MPFKKVHKGRFIETHTHIHIFVCHVHNSASVSYCYKIFKLLTDISINKFHMWNMGIKGKQIKV